MIGINEEVFALTEILKTAETENEKLAIAMNIAELLSEKMEKMDKALQSLETQFRTVVTYHVKDEKNRNKLLSINYRDEIN